MLMLDLLQRKKSKMVGIFDYMSLVAPENGHKDMLTEKQQSGINLNIQNKNICCGGQDEHLTDLKCAPLFLPKHNFTS